MCARVAFSLVVALAVLYVVAAGGGHQDKKDHSSVKKSSSSSGSHEKTKSIIQWVYLPADKKYRIAESLDYCKKIKKENKWVWVLKKSSYDFVYKALLPEDAIEVHYLIVTESGSFEKKTTVRLTVTADGDEKDEVRKLVKLLILSPLQYSKPRSPVKRDVEVQQVKAQSNGSNYDYKGVVYGSENFIWPNFKKGCGKIVINPFPASHDKDSCESFKFSLFIIGYSHRVKVKAEH